MYDIQVNTNIFIYLIIIYGYIDSIIMVNYYIFKKKMTQNIITISEGEKKEIFLNFFYKHLHIWYLYLTNVFLGWKF